MGNLFWDLVTLLVLANFDPSLSVLIGTNDILAVAEADEVVDIKGFLLIPLPDGECEANKDRIVRQLAQIWPLRGEVDCVVTERESFMEVETEISLAPPSYEGLDTPEVVIEVRCVGETDPAFAFLTIRPSRSLAALVDAMTEYASPIPRPEILVSLTNEGEQPLSLSASAVFVQDEAHAAGAPIRIEAGHNRQFRLSDVDAQLPTQGKGHTFATLTFLEAEN